MVRGNNHSNWNAGVFDRMVERQSAQANDTSSCNADTGFTDEYHFAFTSSKAIKAGWKRQASTSSMLGVPNIGMRVPMRPPQKFPSGSLRSSKVFSWEAIEGRVLLGIAWQSSRQARASLLFFEQRRNGKPSLVVIASS